MSEACAVYDAIVEYQQQRVMEDFDESNPHHIDHRRLMDAYVVSESAVVKHSGLRPETVRLVIKAFSLKGDNTGFSGVSEFNEANATPLVPIGGSKYTLVDPHSLAESLYESPFYWMMKDEIYSDTYTNNRGKFTESFCANRLRLVFGLDRVFTNIEIPKSQATTHTEIDVLAHFSDYVVLVQAKSKRLTVNARRGDLNAIYLDFQKGIQRGCDQGYDSAKLLFSSSIKKTLADRYGVQLPKSIRQVFLITVLSDQYPGLSIQVRHLLHNHHDKNIGGPLVLDIFALDVITEFLDSPLYFLSYLKRRCQYSQRVLAAQELTIFAHHLSNNLWLDSDVGLMSLDEGFCRDLDRAMIDRRCSAKRSTIPSGILTRFSDTYAGDILKSIQSRDDGVIFEIGLMLLEMSSQTFEEFDRECSLINRYTIADGSTHDFSMSMSDGKFGITVHCSFAPNEHARDRLFDHCQKRKYQHRSECWFGLGLSPTALSPRFGVRIQGSWEYAREMERKIGSLGRGRKRVRLFEGVESSRWKVGRNDPCPCGSGLKYKKCCIWD